MRIALFLLISVVAAAQVRSRSIRATGEATVSVQPDIVRVSASVRTVAPTAQAASEQNAEASNRIVDQLKTVVGPAGQVRTTSYTLGPNMVQPAPGQPSRQEGFFVTNTVEASSPDLSLAGRIIDVATSAGATTVGGLSFGLRNSSPAQAEALKVASTRAKDQASAIAAGLGLNLGKVLAADEGGAVGRVADAALAAAPGARIEPGLVQVGASVTVEFEIQP